MATVARVDNRARALEDFYRLLARLSGNPFRELAGRAVVCTPCGGNYGKVAYWLLVVNGSPPRGTVLFEAGTDPWPVAYALAGGSRKLGAAQARTVSAFVKEFLGADPVDGEDVAVVLVGGERVRRYAVGEALAALAEDPEG
jgi:hypothetical protein